jgi:hypothetical protein
MPTCAGGREESVRKWKKPTRRAFNLNAAGLIERKVCRFGEDQYGLVPVSPAPETDGSGCGMLLVLPPLGISLGASVLGASVLGISLGGVPVGGTGAPVGGIRCVAPQVSQVGPQPVWPPQCFFEPIRDLSVSNRFGRFATLEQVEHGAGAQETGAGAHPQDFFPNPPMRLLSLSNKPILGSQHPPV